MAPAPLTDAELAAAFAAIGGFEARPLIAVALSGGPTAWRWRCSRIAGRGSAAAAWALTVDHQLRPESAAETHTLAGWFAARGLPHAILVWQGDKPSSGIQEAARAARYELLADWCRRNGVLHLLTAHHREDQAETH